MATSANIQLNNYLQSRQESHQVSWIYSPSGPQNSITWTVTCNYKGEFMASAQAAHKATAKEEASALALDKIRRKHGVA